MLINVSLASTRKHDVFRVNGPLWGERASNTERWYFFGVNSTLLLSSQLLEPIKCWEIIENGNVFPDS